MNAINTALANDAMDRCIQHLRHFKINAPDSLMAKMANTVAKLYPQGAAAITDVVSGVAADIKAVVFEVNRALRDLTKQAHLPEFNAVELAQAQALQENIESFYIKNPVIADEHAVIVTEGQDGQLKVVRPMSSNNPWDMSAWNPRQVPATVKKEMLEFFLANPQIAAREGIRLQEITTNEYVLHQSMRFGVTPYEKRLTMNATGDYTVQDATPKVKPGMNPMDASLRRDRSLNLNLRM